MTAAKDNPTAWNDWQLWNKTEKPDLPDDMMVQAICVVNETAVILESSIQNIGWVGTPPIAYRTERKPEVREAVGYWIDGLDCVVSHTIGGEATHRVILCIMDGVPESVRFEEI